MSEPTQSTVDRLFARALEVPVGDRERFLAEATGGDSELHARVVELLDAASRPDDLLATGGALQGHFGRSMIGDEPSPVPDRIGSFRVVREIGRGGMSTVYLAEREEGGFDQQVAIKLIRPGDDSEELLRRFDRERQILASLKHPGIAQLHDGGTTGDGRPYFTMELVDGLPIVEYCRHHDLDIEHRLDLFRSAVDAVAYAHSRQIVHRDLKPSNILVDNDGQVRLLDFGIAKILAPSESTANVVTRVAGSPLTPEYASPEQVRGEAVTPASDVYQLGVLLYELLTHRPPYLPESRAAIADAICSVTPTRPSALADLAESVPDASDPPGRSKRWYRQLRGDLDTIVMMALRKEPHRRYASAADFSEDVRRYLADQPIAARNDSVRYRLAKFVHRHRAAISAGAVVAVTAAVLMSWMSLRDADVRATAAPIENSVAVLPFAYLGSSGSSYLGDGIADELIAGLAAIPQLRVIARAASFSFRDSDAGVDEIADQLGASVVVTGSVRRSQGELRITAELVDPQGGRKLWSSTYTHDGSASLPLQKRIMDDLVLALTQELGVELSEPGGASKGTTNAEAYENYLLGQYHYLQRGEGVRKSIELFKRAVEMDPNFAHAWAALSSAYSSSLTWGGAEGDIEALVRESATRAIELDDTIGLAHISLGGILARERNYAEGASYLFKALAVSPNDPTVLLWSFEAMATLGRLEDALHFAQRLHEISPISSTSSYAVCLANRALGNNEAAERYCKRAGEQVRGPFLQSLLITHFENRSFDAAEELLEQLRRPDSQHRPGTAYIEARRNPSEETTRAAIVAIEEAVAARKMSINVAFYYYATLGDIDRAYALHSAGLESGPWVDLRLWWLPSLSEFRRDARFMPAAASAGMVGFWRRYGWPDACGVDIPEALCR